MTSEVRGPVVVGMDGSGEANRAAAYGAWEAKRRNVPLRLVFAHQPMPMWGPSILMANDYEWVQDWVRDVLIKAEKEVTSAHPDVQVQTAVLAGSPAAALVDESRTASLIVIGTRATGGFIGHLAGSVAAQVSAYAHAPVIVLRPTSHSDAQEAAIDGRPVVVGMDGSRASELALEFAVAEAVARDAVLDAVYVWSVIEVRDIGPIVPEGYDLAQEESKALRLLTEATAGWSDRYPDLIINRRLVHGLDPVEELVRVSERAGLLVVGSRGHGGFLGLRLGSTVDGLIRTAAAPVAVVRADSTTR